VYLATIPVVSYVYVFVKWYVCIFSELTTFYSYILYVLSMLSISSGVFGALVQRRIKRLIAYSSISTIGYILAGVSGDSIVLTQQCLMYPLIYITNILSIFVVMLNYRFADGQCMDNIRHLSGLYTQNAFAFTAFSIALFSLAGIPPLSGFVSKLLLFTSLSTESMFSLLIFSIIFTLIGSYYYVRIIKMLFYDRVPCTYFYSNPSYNVI
jgi:NADH-quinone oxidoreductase subunit N